MDTRCETEYLDFLVINNLHELVINLIENECPIFVTKYEYVEALLKTASAKKLVLLIQSDLTKTDDLTEKLHLNLIAQDIYFQQDNYELYRRKLNDINFLNSSDKNFNQTDYTEYLLTLGINYRYINMDILFSAKAFDIAYLIENERLLTNYNLILYPEVKALYQKALITDKKNASPNLSAILSAFISGSGRLTYGRFYDALHSAFLTIGSAYLVYKHWKDPPFNYFFVGVGTSFLCFEYIRIISWSCTSQ